MRSSEGGRKRVNWLVQVCILAVLLLCTLAYTSNADTDFFTWLDIRVAKLNLGTSTFGNGLTVKTFNPKGKVLERSARGHVLQWMQVAVQVDEDDDNKDGGSGMEIFTAPPFKQGGKDIYIFRSTKSGAKAACETILKGMVEYQTEALIIPCVSATYKGLDGYSLGYLIPEAENSKPDEVVKSVVDMLAKKQKGGFRSLTRLKREMLLVKLQEEKEERKRKRESNEGNNKQQKLEHGSATVNNHEKKE